MRTMPFVKFIENFNSVIPHSNSVACEATQLPFFSSDIGSCENNSNSSTSISIPSERNVLFGTLLAMAKVQNARLETFNQEVLK